MPRTVSVQRQFAPASPVRRGSARVTDTLPMPHGAVPASGLPRVSLHLPICNEPSTVVRRSLDALSRLDYPEFEVLVIDSNTIDPALWEPVAEHCARLGPRFRFVHLGPWPGGKAGALNFGLEESTPDAVLIGVVESGITLRPDWLRRMVPSFADRAVGFAWSPGGAAASPWTAAAPASADPNVVQANALILLRRSAVEAAGGWAEWAVAEDIELGLRLVRAGWRGAFRRESFESYESFGGERRAMDFAARSRRRCRQAFGAMQACRAHCAALLSPFDHALTLHRRAALFASWLPELGDALSLLFLIVTLVWSAGLILTPRQVGFPAPAWTLLPVLLLAAGFVRGLRRGPGLTGWHACISAALVGLALGPAAGSGAWQALLGGVPMVVDEPNGSPALARRLAPVRGELALLLLAWSAAVGIAVSRGLTEPAAWAWCGMLLVQSSPCLAATVMAVLAISQNATAAAKSRVPNGAIPR